MYPELDIAESKTVPRRRDVRAKGANGAGCGGDSFTFCRLDLLEDDGADASSGGWAGLVSRRPGALRFLAAGRAWIGGSAERLEEPAAGVSAESLAEERVTLDDMRT